MPVVNQDVPFLPTQHKNRPPVKALGPDQNGLEVYLWYIIEDEYLRLTQIFGRDFQATGLGGTKVVGLPSPCKGCGKYTEFVDWVWTALRRGVHTREFMFNSLKNGRQGAENMHDVYCSECGMLTSARSRDNAEGGAPTIELATPLDRTKYDLMPEQVALKSSMASNTPAESQIVAWGQWWLDNTGSTAAYRARTAKEKAQLEAERLAKESATQATDAIA